MHQTNHFPCYFLTMLINYPCQGKGYEMPVSFYEIPAHVHNPHRITLIYLIKLQITFMYLKNQWGCLCRRLFIFPIHTSGIFFRVCKHLFKKDIRQQRVVICCSKTTISYFFNNYCIICADKFCGLIEITIVG